LTRRRRRRVKSRRTRTELKRKKRWRQIRIRPINKSNNRSASEGTRIRGEGLARTDR
jgi:hypothetical protein